MRRPLLLQGPILALVVLALMLVTSACGSTNASKAPPPTVTPQGGTPAATATIGFQVSGWT